MRTRTVSHKNSEPDRRADTGGDDRRRAAVRGRFVSRRCRFRTRRCSVPHAADVSDSRSQLRRASSVSAITGFFTKPCTPWSPQAWFFWTVFLAVTAYAAYSMWTFALAVFA